MTYPLGPAHGIMFHHFHGENHPRGEGSISAADLDAIIRFIGPSRIIHPREWMERVARDDLAPGNLCLTFDDALLCQYEVALPVLERYSLTAFWFVYSSVFEGAVERFEIYRRFRIQYFERLEDFYALFFARIARSPLADRAASVLKDEAEIARWRAAFPFYSDDDVRFRFVRDRALTRREYEQVMDALIEERGFDVSTLGANLWMRDDHLSLLSSREHVIGLHSYSHPMVLARLPYWRQREEYERNAAHIRRVCGTVPVSAAHPVNSYDKRTCEVLRQLGVYCAFRSNMQPPRFRQATGGVRFELARQDHACLTKMLPTHEGDYENQQS